MRYWLDEVLMIGNVNTDSTLSITLKVAGSFFFVFRMNNVYIPYVVNQIENYQVNH